MISSSLVLFLFHPAISLAHIAGKRTKRANATKLLIDRPPLKNAIGDRSHVCVAQVLVRGINGEAWRVHLTTRRCDKPAARQLPRITLLHITRGPIWPATGNHATTRCIPLGIGQWHRIGHAAVAAGKEEHIHLSYSMLRPASSSFCFCLLASLSAVIKAGHEPALLAVLIRDSGLRPVLCQDASLHTRNA